MSLNTKQQLEATHQVACDQQGEIAALKAQLAQVQQDLGNANRESLDYKNIYARTFESYKGLLADQKVLQADLDNWVKVFGADPKAAITREFSKERQSRIEAQTKLAQVEESHDKEIGEFQDEVRNLVIEMSGAPDELIDGKGSDGGWQDLTLAEISQGLAFLKERLAQVEARNRELEVALKTANDVIDNFQGIRKIESP